MRNNGLKEKKIRKIQKKEKKEKQNDERTRSPKDGLLIRCSRRVV